MNRTIPLRIVAVTAALVAFAALVAVLLQGRPGHAAHLAASAVQRSCPSSRVTRTRVGPPTLAVVGASFSAGVGAGTPTRAWPAALGRLLRWRVTVSADSGAG